jgi:hypothetical protein
MKRARLRLLAALVLFGLVATGFALAATALGPSPPRTGSGRPPADACAQSRLPNAREAAARVGAFYFDGWSGPLDGNKFGGLVDGPWSDRQPLSGWSDGTSTSIATQLRWAHRYGISFFMFDWYYGTDTDPATPLNTALDLYRGLPGHNDVGYALVYVNTGRFVVPAAEWRTVVSQWATQDFTRADYARVDGRPLIMILDVARFNRQLGGANGVDRAIASLRTAAIRAGLSGVYVVGGIYLDTRFDWNWFRTVPSTEDFDAFSQYSAPAAAGALSGPQPYPRLVKALEAAWGKFASGSVPFIPDVVTGWDPRPWGSTIDGKLWWFTRTPAQIGAFVRDAVRFAKRRPQTSREPQTDRPLMLMEAWNELGEGAYVVPTVGSCHLYGAAIAAALRPR